MLKQLNLPILIAVILVSLSIFFGSSHFYRQNQVHKVTSYLTSKEEVQDWTVNKIGNDLCISIKPSFTANLSLLWPELEKGLNDILGEKFILSVANDPSLELVAIYEEMKFPFFEGIEKGNLTSMKREIEELAKEKEVEDLFLSIDKDNIYLQLKLDGKALYEVMPRKNIDSSGYERGDTSW